jgi:hypothetical protein
MTIEKQHLKPEEAMLATIFITFLIPLQVHPMTFTKWQRSPAPMVQATIDAARIIGLPRLKTMDSSMHRVIYINEIHTMPMYRVHPRKAFIREFLKTNNS